MPLVVSHENNFHVPSNHIEVLIREDLSNAKLLSKLCVR